MANSVLAETGGEGRAIRSANAVVARARRAERRTINSESFDAEH